jgi:GTPase Era involved in 16S rRNA processing
MGSGNHDLNILLQHPKPENRWLYGEEFFDDEKVVPKVLAEEEIRERVLSLFRTLPIALERESPGGSRLLE